MPKARSIAVSSDGHQTQTTDAYRRQPVYIPCGEENVQLHGAIKPVNTVRAFRYLCRTNSNVHKILAA